MKMLSRISLCALALAGFAASADAQQIMLTHAYSNEAGVPSASASNYITIYAARIAGSPEQEVQALSLRVYYAHPAISVVDFLVPPGATTSLFGKNTAAAADNSDLDFNPLTTHYSAGSPTYTGGFPLRNNANTVPVSWSPGQPTNGAFAPIFIIQFSAPPAPDAFGYTAPNAPNQSGIFVRPWGAEPSGLQLPLGEVAGMAGRQEGVLAVDMIDLSAKATGTGVLISWETGMEIDNAGFNVYSQPEVANSLSKLNPILIGAAGTAASYSYMDSRPLANGEVRGYYVEDVDVTGLSTTLHGPVFVQGGVSANVADWNMF